MMKKELLYPVFLEVCFAVDNISIFWKEVFQDLAYGICPHGCFINKGYLLCNTKGRNFIYKIEKKNPISIFDEICLLFTDKLGVRDEIDGSVKKIDESSQKEEINKWSKIKKKNHKDSLILNFLINMKNKHKINLTKIKKLKTNIHIGLMFKTISPDNITIRNNQIQSIKDIEFLHCDVIYNKKLIDFDISLPKIEFTEKKRIVDLYT
jgi:hypothetical protein